MYFHDFYFDGKYQIQRYNEKNAGIILFCANDMEFSDRVQFCAYSSLHIYL